MKSEFGKGLSYCLALFLCHSERTPWGRSKEGVKVEDDMDKRMRKDIKNKKYSFSTEMWFNGASDHLYELEISVKLPKTLQMRLKRFQSKVIHWGHGFHNDVTIEDKGWAIQEAKDLIRLIDKAYKVKTQKGRCE